jgi:NitT/TauT family transport system substrate-binding protein
MPIVQALQKVRVRLAFTLISGLLGAGLFAAPSSAAEAMKVNIGVASQCSCWLPLYVADAKGFFKEEGLDAKVITFSGGSQSMAAITSGDIQIVGGAGVRGITARSGGLDTLNILSETDGFYLQLMAVKGDLKSIADLKGKTVAVRPGALSDQFTRFLLKRAGIADQVQIVGTPTEQSEVALVQSKQVDAVMTNEPNATFYLAKDMAKPIINFNNLDELKSQGLGDLVPSHTLTYLAKESWLESGNHGDIARKFILAMRKSLDLIKSNPQVAIDTWSKLGGVASGDNPKIIADSIKTSIGSFSKTGCSTKAGMDNLQKLAVSLGRLKEPFPFNKLATNAYFPAGVCAD